VKNIYLYFAWKGCRYCLTSGWITQSRLHKEDSWRLLNISNCIYNRIKIHTQTLKFAMKKVPIDCAMYSRNLKDFSLTTPAFHRLDKCGCMLILICVLYIFYSPVSICVCLSFLQLVSVSLSIYLSFCPLVYLYP